MIDAWQEIARFGRKVVSSGLTSSRFGNISILQDDKIFITATGSMLDELDSSTVVEVDLQHACEMDKIASIETCVHRAIYLKTSKTAIIHTHSPYAVALSMLEVEAVEPIDSEGVLLLGGDANNRGPAGERYARPSGFSCPPVSSGLHRSGARSIRRGVEPKGGLYHRLHG